MFTPPGGDSGASTGVGFSARVFRGRVWCQDPLVHGWAVNNQDAKTPIIGFDLMRLAFFKKGEVVFNNAPACFRLDDPSASFQHKNDFFG